MNHFKQPRRSFLQLGATGVVTALFGLLPRISFSRSPFTDDKGVFVRWEEGTRLITGRKKVPMNVKISKAKNGVEAVSFCVEDMPVGRKMRIHKHLNNDELIFIHKGRGTLTLDERLISVKSGDVAFVPRGIWHGLDNAGKENLSMVFQYTPAGFEEYFIENGTVEGSPTQEKTEEEYAATEEKYGMVYKDKH